MRLRPDLGIGQRLGLGFALLLAIFGAVVAVAYYWSERSAAAEAAFTTRIDPLTRAADDLERDVMRVAIGVRAYLLRPEPLRLQRQETAVANARDSLQRLGALPKEADGEARYRGFAPHVERYLVEAEQIVRRRPGSADGAAAEATLAATREAAMGEVQGFIDLQRGKSQVALAAIEDAREKGTQGLAAAALLALALFAVAAVMMARSIQRPVRGLLRIAAALQRGDWKPALAFVPAAGAPAPRDEMRRLAHAFGAAAQALEAREQRLRADRAIAGASASSLAKEAVADAALRAACDHLGAEVGALYWLEDDARTLTPIALRAAGGAAAPLTLGEGLPGRAALERRSVVAHDIPRDSPFSVKLGYDAAPPRAVAAVPVEFGDGLLGVMLVASLRELGDAELAFLEDAARQMSVGLQNVKTYERVQQLLAELGEKNQQVQAQNEELQAQNEEIQAQNEEIQAQNEELQAQGEEITVQNEQLLQQTDVLREQAGSLAEADRRKSEFLGVLAHELRNPMAAISNSLYALAAAAGGTEQHSRAQEIIRRQTRFLARMVDDLLDVTRISSGKVRLNKEPIDFAAVARECTEDYGDVAEKAGVRLAFDLPAAPLPVLADRTRLCQIVGNLVDNAIKFAGGGREVTVALRTGGGFAELRVKDRGIGMAPDMLVRLFQPFSQADSSLARGKSGLGLGLALAKALVDLHEGTIDAKSDGLGQGAEFIVRVPLHAHKSNDPIQEEKSKPRSGPGVARPGRGRRVLIIEDNPDAALSLRDAMQLAGHEVRIAFDAAEGIELAREFQPEVLLCDIGLPTMDGYQVARRFRSDERLRSTFMVAVTGYAGPEDRERALQSGFDRHLGKPPDIDSLNQLLASLA